MGGWWEDAERVSPRCKSIPKHVMEHSSANHCKDNADESCEHGTFESKQLLLPGRPRHCSKGDKESEMDMESVSPGGRHKPDTSEKEDRDQSTPEKYESLDIETTTPHRASLNAEPFGDEGITSYSLPSQCPGTWDTHTHLNLPAVLSKNTMCGTGGCSNDEVTHSSSLPGGTCRGHLPDEHKKTLAALAEVVDLSSIQPHMDASALDSSQTKCPEVEVNVCISEGMACAHDCKCHGRHQQALQIQELELQIVHG